MRSTTSTARTAPRTVARFGRTRLLAGVLAFAAVAAALVGTAAPASAATVVYKGTAPAGATLWPGDSITSANGQFQLVMQGDGNLVEYGIGRAVLWASNTSGHPGASTQIRKNGTLAIWYGTGRLALWGGAGQVGKNFGIRGDGS